MPRTALNWDQNCRWTRCAPCRRIGSGEMERRIRALRSVRHEGIRPHLALHGRRFALEED